MALYKICAEDYMAVDLIEQQRIDDNAGNEFDELYTGVKKDIEKKEATEEPPPEESADEATEEPTDTPEDAPPEETEGGEGLDDTEAAEEPPADSDTDAKPEDAKEPAPKADSAKGEKDHKEEEKSEGEKKPEETKKEEPDPKKDEAAVKDKDKKVDKDLTASKEGYRDSLATLRGIKLQFATESIDDFASNAYQIGLEGEIDYDKIKHNATTAFNYAGVALKHAFKGISVAIKFMTGAVVKTADAIVNHLERRAISFKNSSARIKKAKSVLELMINDDSKRSLVRQNIDNDTLVRRLKIGSQCSPMQLLSITEHFVTGFYNDATTHGIQSSNAVLAMMTAVIGKKTEASKASLIDHIKFSGFNEKAIKGHEPAENLKSYAYSSTLPGDLIPVIYIANKETKGSKFIMAYDMDSSKKGADLKYLEPDKLMELLNAMDRVCDLLISDEAKVKKLQQIHSQIKDKISTYADEIMQRKEVVNIKESMVETIGPFLEFIDHVYISGIIQTDQMTGRLLADLLLYVEDNLKSFKVDKKS